MADTRLAEERSAMQTPRLALAAAAAFLLSALPAGQAEAQILVHPMKFSASGRAQGVDPRDGDQIPLRIRARDRDLVNLGQGFATSRRAPREEILALLLDCASLQGRIVVYNTLLGTVLQQLTGVIDFSGGAIVGEKDGVQVTSDVRGSMIFNDTPDGANSIEAGLTEAVMQIKYADFLGTQCPSRARGTMLGTLDVTVDSTLFKVLFGNARISVNSPVGTVGVL
jgi:hypothetical protein